VNRGMGKKVLIFTVFAGVLLHFLSYSEAEAVMYVCVDAAGKKQYTNIISSANCRPLSTRFGITKRPRSTKSFSSSSVYKSPAQGDASSYDYHIRKSSRLYDVDPFLIKAVIKTESDFDSHALSSAGAQGLMQLMPETAKELKVRNPYNPGENIDGGTRYLCEMLKLFDGDVPLSLAAYNAGPTLVKRIQRIPRNPETVQYVKKVMAHYKNYRGYLPQSKVRLATVKEQ